MSRTEIPTSSRISRATQASSDSPASTKPASTENRPSGHSGPRATSTWSAPSCTRQITAASVRGYSSRSQPEQTLIQPDFSSTVRAPHLAQYFPSRCHWNNAAAVVKSPADMSSSVAPACRRSSHCGSSVSSGGPHARLAGTCSPASAGISTAKYATPSCSPSRTAFTGGWSPNSVAGRSASRVPRSATNVRPRVSTTIIRALGQSAASFSSSPRNGSHRSIADRDSAGRPTRSKVTGTQPRPTRTASPSAARRHRPARR